jgi:hypothetical protein
VEDALEETGVAVNHYPISSEWVHRAIAQSPA